MEWYIPANKVHPGAGDEDGSGFQFLQGGHEILQLKVNPGHESLETGQYLSVIFFVVRKSL